MIWEGPAAQNFTTAACRESRGAIRKVEKACEQGGDEGALPTLNCEAGTSGFDDAVTGVKGSGLMVCLGQACL